LIKINLISEGRAAVRGAAAPGAAAAETSSDLNNQLMIGLMVIGLLAAGGYWFMKKSARDAMFEQVDAKQVEAQSLEKIIQEVEQFKTRKAQLEERIALINDLKKNQKVPVRVMDRISQDLPDLLWLDRMVLAGTQITLEGRALNPNAVAIFTDNLKQDPLFTEPNLSKVELQGTNVYTFAMTFSFREVTDQPAPEEGAPADPAVATGA